MKQSKEGNFDYKRGKKEKNSTTKNGLIVTQGFSKRSSNIFLRRERVTKGLTQERPATIGNRGDASHRARALLWQEKRKALSRNDNDAEVRNGKVAFC